MKNKKKKIIEYWNSRAVNVNKKLSGSNDEQLHKFETKFMNDLIKNKNKSIFDLGCGNGSFLKDLNKSKKFKRIVGIDISHNMISESKKQNLKNSKFYVSDVEQISDFKNLGKFDYVTSKRCLINLLSSKRQFLVINKIANFLKKGGSYFACESSSIALKNINLFRKKAGLKNIKSPWHNLYINDQNLGVFAVEESFSKELIERQKLRNGPIFGISEEFGEIYPNIKYELYSERYWINEYPKN